MILPTKGIKPRDALLAIGAVVLRHLEQPKTISRVWNETRSDPEAPPGLTFDWFVLTLDLLFTIEAIDHEEGQLRRFTGGQS